MSIPKKILRNSIDKYLREKLENHGFKYSESSLKFSRRTNKFTHSIYFEGAKFNYGDEIVVFFCWYKITFRGYQSWKKKILEIERPIGDGSISGNMSRLQAYENGIYKLYFDFNKLEHDQIMDTIYEHFLNNGLNYFADNREMRQILKSKDIFERIDFGLMTKSLEEVEKEIIPMINKITKNISDKSISYSQRENEIMKRYEYFKKLKSEH